MLSWRTLRRFGTAALAPAVLLMAAVPAFARPGHGGGGFHGGGFHGGGFHGGAHGGAHGGGFHGGGFHGGFNHSNHFNHFGGGWGGWGWPYYGLGGYGYGYPSYYGSAYVNNPGYVDYSSYYPPVDATGYVAPADYGVATPSYGVAPAPDDTAHVTLNVPPDAEVWFDGDKTQQTGPTRAYVSPPLTPGQAYTYHVRARWTENGKPVEQKRDVRVRANQQTVETFTAGAPNRAQVPSATD